MRIACLLFSMLFSISKTSAQVQVPGPRLIVYKTKQDYNNLVPVVLSDDKTKIVSYPHPDDLRVNGHYMSPTTLKKGYLLDNRGIGRNVAFLKMTYEQFTALRSAPSLDEMSRTLADKEPLLEMYDCGNKGDYKNPVKYLNKLIKKKKLLSACKTL